MTDYKNEPPRLTYYKYKCPNGTHLFTLVDDVETCVYCYIEDNSPKAIEALLSKRELEARVEENQRMVNTFEHGKGIEMYLDRINQLGGQDE